MEDRQIVALFWARDERAVSEAAAKYGSYCFSIASHILGSRQDAEECVNDTWQGAWSSIPPHRPERLATYLGKLTRRLSMKVLRRNGAEKRGGGQAELSLEELEECLPAGDSVEAGVEFTELVKLLNTFLGALPAARRRVFVRRYWYGQSIAELCKESGFSKSKVESMLHRTRVQLKKYLEQEWYMQ